MNPSPAPDPGSADADAAGGSGSGASQGATIIGQALAELIAPEQAARARGEEARRDYEQTQSELRTTRHSNSERDAVIAQMRAALDGDQCPAAPPSQKTAWRRGHRSIRARRVGTLTLADRWPRHARGIGEIAARVCGSAPPKWRLCAQSLASAQTTRRWSCGVRSRKATGRWHQLAQHSQPDLDSAHSLQCDARGRSWGCACGQLKNCGRDSGKQLQAV